MLQQGAGYVKCSRLSLTVLAVNKFLLSQEGLTSGISRRLFTLGTESSGASPPRGFLLLESWRAVKTPSRGCFSDDLEFTEQSRAASSASVSTFTVLFFRTVAERKWGSVGRPWFSRVPRHQAVRSHPLIFSLK